MLQYEYVFNCVQLEYYPPIFTSNVNRKCVFDIAVSQLEELEPSETNDHINVDKFWNSVDSEIITKRLIKKGEKDPCQRIPTYKFWGPSIGQKSRISNVIPNTEYRKLKPVKTEDNNQDIVTEDILFDLVYTKRASVVNNICQQCNHVIWII